MFNVSFIGEKSLAGVVTKGSDRSSCAHPAAVGGGV